MTHPQTKTRYNLTIIADPPEEELLPLAPPKMDNSTISPDHLDWPCVSTEVSADERCSLWSSLCPVTHVILTPKLIQAAYALLKVSNQISMCVCIDIIVYSYLYLRKYSIIFIAPNIPYYLHHSKYPKNIQIFFIF